VLGLEAYLLGTWHSTTRPPKLDLASDAGRTWLSLSIRERVDHGEDHAEVAFVARFRQGGDRARRFSERSRFVRESGSWYYVDGQVSII
jgi:SEC-C motif-containing protein